MHDQKTITCKNGLRRVHGKNTFALKSTRTGATRPASAELRVAHSLRSPYRNASRQGLLRFLQCEGQYAIIKLSIDSVLIDLV